MKEMCCVSKDNLKGFLLIGIGLTLLLHSLGLFQQWLSMLIIIGSIALIIRGAMLSHLPTHIMQWIKELKGKTKE